MPTKFGPQPLGDELRALGLRNHDLARAADVPDDHVSNVCRGIIRPAPAVIEMAEQFTGKDRSELFSAEVLAEPYRPRRPAGGTYTSGGVTVPLVMDAVVRRTGEG